MISITCIFFIIDYKYKDDGGMKKGLNRFAGLKFNGGMVELFSSLKKGSMSSMGSMGSKGWGFPSADVGVSPIIKAKKFEMFLRFMRLEVFSTFRLCYFANFA